MSSRKLQYIHTHWTPLYVKINFQRICANLKRSLNISGEGSEPPIPPPWLRHCTDVIITYTLDTIWPIFMVSLSGRLTFYSISLLAGKPNHNIDSIILQPVIHVSWSVLGIVPSINIPIAVPLGFKILTVFIFRPRLFTVICRAIDRLWPSVRGNLDRPSASAQHHALGLMSATILWGINTVKHLQLSSASASSQITLIRFALLVCSAWYVGAHMCYAYGQSRFKQGWLMIIPIWDNTTLYKPKGQGLLNMRYY